MSVADNRSTWQLATMVALLTVSSACATEQSERDLTDASPVAEWMRGVPRGCRLVSFNLLAGQVGSLGREDRVDVLWDYALSDRRSKSAPLIQDVGLLAAEPSENSAGVSILRVTLALTPHQANRLRLAVACSRLRLKRTASGSPQSNNVPSTWDVQGVEDRTGAIEASLSRTVRDKDTLERPTLAAPPGVVSTGFRGVIAVPVEVENQP